MALKTTLTPILPSVPTAAELQDPENLENYIQNLTLTLKQLNTNTYLDLLNGSTQQQPSSANLDTFSGITPSADVVTMLQAANDAAILTAIGAASLSAANTFTNAGLTTFGGNIQLGTNVASAVAAPINICLGGTYGNSTPGSAANLKFILFSNTTVFYGIGISSGLIEYQAGTSGGHQFFVNNGTSVMVITSTGYVAIGTVTPVTGALLTVNGIIAAQTHANGSVATTMTSLGPSGSHTTIQEWLEVYNLSGTLRYVPCY